MSHLANKCNYKVQHFIAQHALVHIIWIRYTFTLIRIETKIGRNLGRRQDLFSLPTNLQAPFFDLLGKNSTKIANRSKRICSTEFSRSNAIRRLSGSYKTHPVTHGTPVNNAVTSLVPPTWWNWFIEHTDPNEARVVAVIDSRRCIWLSLWIWGCTLPTKLAVWADNESNETKPGLWYFLTNSQPFHWLVQRPA